VQFLTTDRRRPGICPSLNICPLRRLFIFLPRARDELSSSPLYPPFTTSPLSTARGLGSAVSPQTIWCTLESKSAALVAALFVAFPKSKCNFLHKNSEAEKTNCIWVQFLTGRRPIRSLFPGPVATIALRKSAPMSVTAESGHVRDNQLIYRCDVKKLQLCPQFCGS